MKLFLLRIRIVDSIILGLNSTEKVGEHGTILGIAKCLWANNGEFRIFVLARYGFQTGFKICQGRFQSKQVISVIWNSCRAWLSLKHTNPFAFLLRIVKWWQSLILFRFYDLLLVYNFGAGWLNLCVKLEVVKYGLLYKLFVLTVEWALQLIDHRLHILTYLYWLLVDVWCTLSLGRDWARLTSHGNVLNTGIL